MNLYLLQIKLLLLIRQPEERRFFLTLFFSFLRWNVKTISFLVWENIMLKFPLKVI